MVMLEKVIDFPSCNHKIFAVVHIRLAQQFLHAVCYALSLVHYANRYLCDNNTGSNSLEMMFIKL